MAKNVVTSGEVAKLAKVSQSAVSRTFTPGAIVAEDTRKKVLAAAKQLGYRPNALAQAVKGGRSRMVAVLFTYLDNQFYPLALEALSRGLQAEGYQVLLFMTDRGNQDQMVQKMLQFQVEGIVMASAEMSSDLARECVETGIPVVLFNRYVAASISSSVTSDNLRGAFQLTELLLAAGHKRLAFIAGAEDSSTNKDRETGFIGALARAGLRPFARESGDYDWEKAAEATRRLFSGKEKPDAIFVANDHMAFSVIDVIRDELGLKIPDDVSVVGFDDVPEAGWGGYKLTTVRQSLEGMISATIAILTDQMDRKLVDSTATVLPSSVVIRRTARMPAAEVCKEILGGG